MQRLLGISLVVISSAFAAIMLMRGIGRFFIFLVVDRPEVGAGFLLSTFATTGLALYIAWQVGSKGIDLASPADVGNGQIETEGEAEQKSGRRH